MKTALLVIDVQMAFVHDDEGGAERSCPDAEANIETLLSAFRQRGDVVVHIHHNGVDSADPFHADAPGSQVQPFAEPLKGEPTVVKHGGSGFVGTALEADLRKLDVNTVVLCGATANHCVESTTRTASDLGFEAVYVSDAVWAYAATGPDGQAHGADQVHSVTLSNLAEFASVLTTTRVLSS